MERREMENVPVMLVRQIRRVGKKRYHRHHRAESFRVMETRYKHINSTYANSE